MRILHLNVLYPPAALGGAERFVAALAREQVAQGHQVAVVTMSRQPQEMVVEDGVEVYRIGHGNFFWFEDWPKHSAPMRYLNKLTTNWNPITLKRVREVVSALKPDLVNTHCMLSFAVDSWKAAFERHIPIVHTLHEYNLICRNSNAFRNGAMCESMCWPCLYNAPKRRMSSMITAVTAVSSETLKRHTDMDFFTSIPTELRRIIWGMSPIPVRERTESLDGQPFTFGFIGRIVPEKGLEVLLRAMKAMKIGKWRLLVGGTASPVSYLEDLKRQSAGLPVEWLGRVDAASFYPKTDVIVIPPLWAEPGPLIVQEAFANFVPVVGSRIGGIKDMVENNVTGWLFEPNDDKRLTEILNALVENGRGQLPTADKFRRFQAKTSPQSVAAKYEDFYKLVLAKAPIKVI